MTVVFISNYINHHQIPFCNACYKQWGEDFVFIQTQPMEQERLDMGWSRTGEKLPYVLCYYEEEKRCRDLILESNVLLAGWNDKEELVQERLNAGKLTIRISERLYREGQWKAVSPKGLLHKYREHIRYRKSPAYLLCAGAYVASDFHLIHAYPGKMFKWGYFPETRKYSQAQLLAMKEKEGVHIVWAGRFIPLKHPENMIRLAKEVSGCHIHMIGSGEMEQQLRDDAEKLGLEDRITFYGFQTPEQVRNIMEKCHIHVFTSNHLEGWGAVVNEAMNSGCVVVANAQAGAVPYLIRQSVNGIAYPAGNYGKMREAVEYLIRHPEEREKMALAAYETVR
ncbi:MAG: glycosyltransferase, partial [Lachnospiraceae bacterium]|nr:glycosyltransferase [Lachnospiraceae bacterium]